MKFINLTLFAICNINLALSKALTGQNKCNDQFCFWATNEGSAVILGFSENNQSTTNILTIPGSVNFDGQEYYINGAGIGAFSENEAIEEVHIPSSIDNFYLDSDAFSGCSNLKKVVFDNKSVSAADLSSFNYPNMDISFSGKGVKSYTNDQVSKLVSQWGFSVKDYSRESEYTKKEDLFELGKTLTQYLRISYYEDSGNAIVALKDKFGSYDGYARLYRLFAIAMGIPESDIYVASDGDNHYWNYVFVDNQWYNVDVLYYPFRRYSIFSQFQHEKPFFLTYEAYKNIQKDKITAQPSQWVVLHSNYGYPDELNGQQESENFDAYLNQHQLGYRA